MACTRPARAIFETQSFMYPSSASWLMCMSTKQAGSLSSFLNLSFQTWKMCLHRNTAQALHVLHTMKIAPAIRVLSLKLTTSWSGSPAKSTPSSLIRLSTGPRVIMVKFIDDGKGSNAIIACPRRSAPGRISRRCPSPADGQDTIALMQM